MKVGNYLENLYNGGGGGTRDGWSELGCVTVFPF